MAPLRQLETLFPLLGAASAQVLVGINMGPGAEEGETVRLAFSSAPAARQPRVLNGGKVLVARRSYAMREPFLYHD
jgi:hypothetical protein